MDVEEPGVGFEKVPRGEVVREQRGVDQRIDRRKFLSVIGMGKGVALHQPAPHREQDGERDDPG